MAVKIPASATPVQVEAWRVAGDLSRLMPTGWVVVGGQMVQFHGWRTGNDPERTTTDLDVALAIRSDRFALREATRHLQEAGFSPMQHDSGIEYRWTRASQMVEGAKVQVDILLPRNLGERYPRSITGADGFESAGVQWATEDACAYDIDVAGELFTIPVPDLVGAILAKSAAILHESTSHGRRHSRDLAFLCRIATRGDLARRVSGAQRDRIARALEACGDDVTRDMRQVMGRLAGQAPELPF